MRRYFRSGLMLGMVGTFLWGAMILAGRSKGLAVEQAGSVIPTENSGKLIVHEWGTFTSFSGSNGAQLDFRPLLDQDLPEFVFDRHLQSGAPIFTKGRYRARVRMETPVTYFYTDRERIVNASVEFPEGLLTEFYPPVKEMLPKWNYEATGDTRLGNSKLDWGEIHLIPPASLAPAVQDQRTRKWLTEVIQQNITPKEANWSNHYYHARATDSAFVHFHATKSEGNPHLLAQDYIEKFLFYRGLGRFNQPLKTTVGSSGQVRVTNSADQPIRSLFQVTVSGKAINFSTLSELKPGQTADFPRQQQPTTLQELQDCVTEALVREQLYTKEAVAMVKTWADSWFAEEGTRVFYMVPRELTDKVLPLTISPAPDETVRVLVGRIEVMPPSLETELLEIVAKHAIERSAKQAEQAAEGNSKPIQLEVPPLLIKLGRLAEPALVRIRELAPDSSTSIEAEILMRECREALNKTLSAGT